MTTKRLREQMKLVASDVSRLAQAASSDAVGEHLVARLRTVIDNATGCAVLAENDLGPPLMAVARSIFESLLVTYWATLSDTNAQTVLSTSRNEGLRLVRNLLRNNRGVVKHKITGENFTDELLKSPELDDLKPPPRFDKIAEDTGLKKLYDNFYGFFSMFAHGNATDLIPKAPNEYIAPLAEAVRVYLKAIHAIVGNYVRERRITTHEEVGQILKLLLP